MEHQPGPHEVAGAAIAGAWQHTVHQAGRVAQAVFSSWSLPPAPPQQGGARGWPSGAAGHAHARPQIAVWSVQDGQHKPVHEQLGSALQQLMQRLAPQSKHTAVQPLAQHPRLHASGQPKHDGHESVSQASPVLASLTASSLLASASASSSTRGWGAAGQSPVDMSSSAARKAELGRCTWTLLHMLAAQYPDKPSRQQKRDVKQLIDCLTRVYPCGQCASHFMQIVKRDPPTVGSKQELQAWTCRVHNVVNRSLGKPTFNCDVAAARWSPLDCGSDGDDAPASVCDMTVGQKGKR